MKLDLSLFDVWHKCNPRAVSFTWSNSGKTQASRLDCLFLSKALFAKVVLSHIFLCFSDHDFVTLEITLNGVPNRKNLVWKLNSLLLSDVDFKQLITNEIQKRKLEVHNFSSLGDWWDNRKACIRILSMNFSVSKHRKANADRTLLTKRLICAKNALH